MAQVTVSLNDRQAALLAATADNGGIIHVGGWMPPADRKAADALVRCGLLSPGSGPHGTSARHLTDNGRRVHNDLTRGRTAAIIAPHISGDFRRSERAEGSADDLHRAGYLTGGDRAGRPDVIGEATAILQCRHDWTTAERIARELADAGLLAGTTNRQED